MTNYTKGEQDYLQKIAKRLNQLRDFLDSADFEQDMHIGKWFECLSQVKAIQGNVNNNISFIACLMAKNYLAQRFDIKEFDISIKPQGAPGLDIDLKTADDERIIGEIKTTVPYSGAKNDLGAKQKETFQHDFNKLNTTPANHKFFFVTDRATFEVMQRRYASQIPGVNIVLLVT